MYLRNRTQTKFQHLAHYSLHITFCLIDTSIKDRRESNENPSDDKFSSLFVYFVRKGDFIDFLKIIIKNSYFSSLSFPMDDPDLQRNNSLSAVIQRCVMKRCRNEGGLDTLYAHYV
ncbi:CLUMA_CG007277, isoform A [Clunio marinus]|uniref:CLUMA_CG007277, isoform A n=1 Tax=Clunio marinus TaxID=568069 RepID=A0A1J1I0E9_9DIPT|nr:CLUMA_CG007277, isoform A [Clunio marinus]